MKGKGKIGMASGEKDALMRTGFRRRLGQRNARGLIPGASEREGNGGRQLEKHEDNSAALSSEVKPHDSSDMFQRWIVRSLKRKERKERDEEP